MPQPALRLNVITLICDSNFKHRADTNTWSHRDGRPLTEEEQKTALSCTRYEFEIAAAQIKREIEYRRERAELPDALCALLAPYFARLPAGSTVSDVEPLMTDEDRAEYERLRDLRRVPPRLRRGVTAPGNLSDKASRSQPAKVSSGRP